MLTYTSHKGFTLAQMLIVAAIIGVMSTIAYGSLSDARKKARDTQRETDLQTLALALKLYKEKYDTYTVSNSGHSNGGNGWVSYEGGAYTRSLARALYEEGLLASPTIRDPIQTGAQGYMIYVCDGGLSFSLSATKEIEKADEKAYARTVCNGTGGNNIVDAYGKNYAVSSK